MVTWSCRHGCCFKLHERWRRHWSKGETRLLLQGVTSQWRYCFPEHADGLCLIVQWPLTVPLGNQFLSKKTLCEPPSQAWHQLWVYVHSVLLLGSCVLGSNCSCVVNKWHDFCDLAFTQPRRRFLWAVRWDHIVLAWCSSKFPPSFCFIFWWFLFIFHFIFWDYNIVTIFLPSPSSLQTFPHTPPCISNSWSPFLLIIIVFLNIAYSI